MRRESGARHCASRSRTSRAAVRAKGVVPDYSASESTGPGPRGVRQPQCTDLGVLTRGSLQTTSPGRAGACRLDVRSRAPTARTSRPFVPKYSSTRCTPIPLKLRPPGTSNRVGTSDEFATGHSGVLVRPGAIARSTGLGHRLRGFQCGTRRNHRMAERTARHACDTHRSCTVGCYMARLGSARLPSA